MRPTASRKRMVPTRSGSCPLPCSCSPVLFHLCTHVGVSLRTCRRSSVQLDYLFVYLAWCPKVSESVDRCTQGLALTQWAPEIRGSLEISSNMCESAPQRRLCVVSSQRRLWAAQIKTSPSSQLLQLEMEKAS
jgi:hypothetical protein